MLRQVLSFLAVISLIQYYASSLYAPVRCVALYRCPELFSAFQKDEMLISLKEFLSKHSCSGSIFPPPKVNCPNPVLETSLTFFQDVALEPVNVSISAASEDLWSLCDCGVSPKYESAISRKNKAEEGMFPWMVQIYYTEYKCVDSCDSITEDGNITLCAGSIITKRHILTSAHCVVRGSRLARELKVVLAGTVQIEHNYYEIKVSMVFSHPNYNSVTWSNDLAILYLEEDIQMSHRVRPVCLHSGTIYHNTRLFSAGWGLTEHGNSSDHLLYIDDQVVWNREVCNNAYDNRLTEDMLCTKGLSGASVCHGDSGGPLLGTTKPHDTCSQSSTTAASPVWVVLGVTSFGNVVCNAEKPAIFAHVVHFLPWIKDTVERARLSPTKIADLFSNFKPKKN